MVWEVLVIKYRNALGHAMRSNEHADREVFIGEIDKTPLIFTEDLFRQMRASLNEYQQVINLVENSFNQIWDIFREAYNWYRQWRNAVNVSWYIV